MSVRNFVNQVVHCLDRRDRDDEELKGVTCFRCHGIQSLGDIPFYFNEARPLFQEHGYRLLMLQHEELENSKPCCNTHWSETYVIKATKS